MNLREIQYTKVLNRVLKEQLRKGRFPRNDDVYTATGQEFFDRQTVVGHPWFSGKKQPHGRKVVFKDFVDNFVDAVEDVENIYDAANSAVYNSIKHFSYVEVKRAANERALKDMRAELDSLLLVANNSNGFFSIVYDAITDTSKIDMDNTTAFVDTAVGAVMLPTLAGTKRLSLEHEMGLKTPRSWYVTPTDSIISDKTLSNNHFSNALDDSSTTWSQEVITSTNEKIYMSFTINLSRDNIVKTINAIDLESITPGEPVIALEYSNDSINWYNLPCPNYIRVLDSRESWRFPAVEASTLRITIRKDTPDYEKIEGNTLRYVWTLGLRRIAVMEMPLESQAELISEAYQVLDPRGSAITPDKVSGRFCQTIPEGTHIFHYVALCDADGALTSSWQQIQDYTETNPNIAKVIDFRTAEGQTLTEDVTIAPTIHGASINGLQLYYIFQPGDFSGSPITESLELRRGRNCFVLNNALWESFFYMKQDGQIEIDQTEVGLSLSIDGGVELGNPTGLENLKLDLAKGWHKAVCDSTAQDFSAIFPNLLTDIDEIYAFKRPMQLVSESDLVYQTFYRDHRRYAIQAGTDGVYVIINWDPTNAADIGTDIETIKYYDGTPTVDYFQLKYRYHAQGGYLKYRAVFQGPGGTGATSILSGYRLRIQ